MVKMVILISMLQQEMFIRKVMELGIKLVILEDLKEKKVKKVTRVKMVRTVELQKLK